MPKHMGLDWGPWGHTSPDAQPGVSFCHLLACLRPRLLLPFPSGPPGPLCSLQASSTGVRCRGRVPYSAGSTLSWRRPTGTCSTSSGSGGTMASASCACRCGWRR